MATISLNFKVPKELYEKIKQVADKKNIAMAAMIRVILSDYFEEKK